MKKRISVLLIGLMLLALIAVLLTGYGMKAAGLFEKNQWTITQYGPRDINSSFILFTIPEKA